MDEDLAWQRETIQVPWRLATALELDDRVRRFTFLQALAPEIDLDPGTTTPVVDELLDSMQWPLEAVLEAGLPVSEDAPRAVAHKVVANRWPYDLVHIAAGFGWADQTAVQNTVTFGRLEIAVEESFEKLLANRVFVLLRRWEKHGIFQKVALGVIPIPRKTRRAC